jgi:hypothetical protein
MLHKVLSKRFLLLTGVFLIPLALIFSQCFINDNPESKDPRGILYAGSASCIKCHKDIYSNYLHTAHFQTSRLAGAGSVHGSFAGDSNTVVLSDSLKVVMEKQGKTFYQSSYRKGKLAEKQPFNLVFGGVKAETYLYWKGKQMLQLPISYYNAIHSWGNSPGYEGGYADFSRVIGRRCFECHSSYVNEIPQATQSLNRTIELDKNSMILSIDCERCHGPAINHVNYHTEYPGQKVGKYIVRYSTLSRSQKIDVCAVCHSGNTSMMLRSAFRFHPGDTLAKFKEVDLFRGDVNPAKLDVHGNQVQLLASSPCFIKSKMDCATCHNTHNNQRNLTQMFTQRCMNCHSEAKHNFCKMAGKLSNDVLQARCIDCHMPAKPSSVITVNNNSKSTQVPYEVRTHRITIYPDETRKIMDWVKTNQQTHKL